jgi:hypothetical protein
MTMMLAVKIGAYGDVDEDDVCRGREVYGNVQREQSHHSDRLQRQPREQIEWNSQHAQEANRGQEVFEEGVVLGGEVDEASDGREDGVANETEEWHRQAGFGLRRVRGYASLHLYVSTLANVPQGVERATAS